MPDSTIHYKRHTASTDWIRKRLSEAGCMPLALTIEKDTGVPIDVFLGRSTCKSAARARRKLYRALRIRGFSLPQIGRMLDRDHTTILHGLRPVGAQKQGYKPSTLAHKLPPEEGEGEVPNRILLAFDGVHWYVRRVQTVVLDMEHGLRVYRCDRALSGQLTQAQAIQFIKRGRYE